MNRNYRLGVDTNIEAKTDVVAGELEQFLEQFDDIDLVLFGNQKSLEKTSSYPALENRVRIIHTPYSLPGDADPRKEFKKIKKAKYSMALGIMAHLTGQIDCFVSNGPSGFMAAAAHYQKLGSLVGKAIPYFNFPSVHKESVAVGDAGAFGDSTAPADIFVYGILLREELKSCGIGEPKIALLNMGREPSKGDETLQKAYAALEEHLPGFVGNREGFDLHWDPDVDGFIARGDHGNVGLKSSEGTLDYILDYVAQEAGVEPEKIQKMRDIIGLKDKEAGIFLGTKLNLFLGHGRSGPLSPLRIARTHLQNQTSPGKVYAEVEKYAPVIEGLK